MKKIIWKVTLVLAVLLCFFGIAGGSTLHAHAADKGTLIKGKDFDYAIKEMVWGKKVESLYDPDYNVSKIVFTRDASVLPKNMKSTSVGTDVTAYYDTNSKAVYIYTTAPRFIFNQDSSWMFMGFTVAKSIDFGKNQIDTSKVENVVHMFSRMVNLQGVDVSEFNTANVADFTSMFYLCVSIKSLDLRNFNTSKSKQFNAMFYRCSQLQSVNLSSFDTSNSSSYFGMFYQCRGLKSLDISNFNSKVKIKYTEEMFNGCTKLEYLNIRNLDLTGTDTKNMFIDCKALKRVVAPRVIDKEIAVPVKLVLDNDDDLVADSAAVYEGLPVANTSNSYLALSEAQSAAEKKNSGDLKAVTDSNGRLKAVGNGFVYLIGNDSTVSVSKITAPGKVKVDTVTIGGVSYPVSRIEAEACKGNTKIKSIEIGQSVTSIGKNAFSGCKNLKKVKIKANKALKVEKNAFKKINKRGSIVVKGLKGKVKKKMVKAIKKQTNAKVK